MAVVVTAEEMKLDGDMRWYRVVDLAPRTVGLLRARPRGAARPVRPLPGEPAFDGGPDRPLASQVGAVEEKARAAQEVILHVLELTAGRDHSRDVG